MIYRQNYATSDGFDDMVMISDGEKLTGLLFTGSEDIRKLSLPENETSLPVFDKTKKWLDEYFGGKIPSFTPDLCVSALSPFQKTVSGIMMGIPYGKTMTYGEMATIIAKERGIKRMSARAVGGAVGANPICIIIPCHRVLGAHGAITGYGGGIKNKENLLKLEKIPFRDSVRHH